MSEAQKTEIIEMLRGLQPPDGKGDVVSRGMVSDIFIADGKAFFSLSVASDEAERFEPFRREIEQRVAGIAGIASAMVALTAERAGGGAGRTAPPPRPPVRPAAPGGRPAPASGAPPAAARPAAGKPGVPGIDKIVAVASGKGGVGKSTTAVNLALAFAALGLKVGILDADIYGPSVPRLLDIRDKPKSAGGRTMLPLEAYGLKAMSMGFLVDEETPMIWRGPMVMSALTQMLREVEWGTLDLLVVDMPPGTGDAQLTMAQQVPLAGAVIVSTPQDLALLDARKGLAMFRKVDVPVLGIVENMSYFVCPNCGTSHDVFGHGGARREADRLGVPFLGEVPLDMRIRETSDAGSPIVACEPEGPHAKVFADIAAKTLAGIEGLNHAAAPRIVFE
ncbi:Mrp/NBP35 family ATP-binding protein [Mangrovibrevibacter kandeliae]|uniref:Mrp/NBP35 family ATP-binding protein n=1 Tax=Mangrovibrevibacter kandeliae TaxID=2968473 RepID=UPI002118ABB5|nr:Mrp/NBP35 family ATP-binding protein [Aurantimonas sp. CSK15Z-1]MCQ8780962.1 Mrp/NBP35 family ATP-binding protein [Aurantimonas sp. CSK15Z-1]